MESADDHDAGKDEDPLSAGLELDVLGDDLEAGREDADWLLALGRHSEPKLRIPSAKRTADHRAAVGSSVRATRIERAMCHPTSELDRERAMAIDNPETSAIAEEGRRRCHAAGLRIRARDLDHRLEETEPHERAQLMVPPYIEFSDVGSRSAEHLDADDRALAFRRGSDRRGDE